VGVIAVAATGVAMVASNAWMGEGTTFISFFEESVNGLDRGAPVKFQGVPVGTVTELLIQIDLGDKTFRVPVQYEIDLTRLTSRTGTFVNLSDPAVLATQIRDGLRAELQMESIVTGQLYVELVYADNVAPAVLELGPTAFPAIPTKPSLLAAFGTQAGSLVGGVLDVIFRINEMLTAVDMQSINAAVVSAAQAVESLVDSDELRAAVLDAPVVTAQFREVMSELQILTERIAEKIDPLHLQLEHTTEEVVLTLRALRQAIDDTGGFLSGDTGVGYQVERAMSSLADAAEALRVLAISLERNPDMLIRGTNPPER
jgi:paraquat-inducible protein B